MSSMKEAQDNLEKKQRELEETIVAVVRELYRLQGKPCYEPTSPELESVVQGNG